VVRLAHLGHPAFLELLRQAEEEYGFPAGASGPVALSCDEHRLRDVLRRVSSSSSNERRRSSGRRGGDQRPLLQG
jgi:SAUR family protein